MSSFNLDSVLSTLQKSLDFTKEVEMMGITYQVRLLSLSEEQKANSDPEMENLEGAAFMNRMRSNILSYSITKINEYIFDPIMDYEEKDGTIVKKERSIVVRDILARLPADIIEALFDIYVDLKEESEEKIKKNLNYKWFKDPETREKEMKERIRKLRQESEPENESINFREVPVPPKEGSPEEEHLDQDKE